jgi:hypothetical protein
MSGDKRTGKDSRALKRDVKQDNDRFKDVDKTMY